MSCKRHSESFPVFSRREIFVRKSVRKRNPGQITGERNPYFAYADRQYFDEGKRSHKAQKLGFESFHIALSSVGIKPLGNKPTQASHRRRPRYRSSHRRRPRYRSFICTSSDGRETVREVSIDSKSGKAGGVTQESPALFISERRPREPSAPRRQTKGAEEEGKGEGGKGRRMMNRKERNT